MDQKEIKKLEEDLLAYAHLQARKDELDNEYKRMLEAFEQDHAELIDERKQTRGMVDERKAELIERIQAAAHAGAKFTKGTHGVEVKREVVIEITDERAFMRWLLDNNLDKIVKRDRTTGHIPVDEAGEPIIEFINLVTLNQPRSAIARIRELAIDGNLPFAYPHFEVPLVSFDSKPDLFLKKWQKEPGIEVVDVPQGPDEKPEGEEAKASRRKATWSGAEDDADYPPVEDIE